MRSCSKLTPQDAISPKWLNSVTKLDTSVTVDRAPRVSDVAREQGGSWPQLITSASFSSRFWDVAGFRGKLSRRISSCICAPKPTTPLVDNSLASSCGMLDIQVKEKASNVSSHCHGRDWTCLQSWLLPEQRWAARQLNIHGKCLNGKDVTSPPVF